jgi:tRNA U55 pseudouridine synthase TruB
MHSALKKDGKALYEYARAGIDVEREAREVDSCIESGSDQERKRKQLSK